MENTVRVMISMNESKSNWLTPLFVFGWLAVGSVLGTITGFGWGSGAANGESAPFVNWISAFLR